MRRASAAGMRSGGATGARRRAAATSLRAAPATPCAADARDAEEGQIELPRRGASAPQSHRRDRDRRRRSCWRRRSAASAASVGWNSSSSRRTVSRSSTGSRPLAPDTSTRCTSTFVRSRCRRNWWPRPRPRCAPSIRPGTSATTKLRSSLRRDDAEIRRERGERVVGDLRPRRRDARDERRLAGVGKSDEADVGEQLQLEAEILDLARLARLHLARRAIGGGREPRVAHAAAAAFRDQHALAFAPRDRRAGAAAGRDRRSSRRRACRSALRARGRRRRVRCGSIPCPCWPRSAVNSGWKR